MPIEIKSPYTTTPYEILVDRELGPLPTNVSCREVDERWAALVKRGRPADTVHKAKDALRQPRLRIACDIFLLPGAQNQQLLQELAALRPTFQPSLQPAPDLALGRSFLLLDDGADDGPLELAPRDMSLSMSTHYEEAESPLQAISFDI